MSSIDKLVDGASQVKLLSFIDVYSSYNQIKIHSLDDKKMTFIIESTNYCYKVMSFRLKNTGATYQRLMNKIFTNYIRRIIEVYVDNIVAKTIGDRDHYKDLREIVAQIRKFDMRLNLRKYTFRVQGGKFLEFLLTSRGIEVIPKKCRAILEIRSLSTLKECSS